MALDPDIPGERIPGPAKKRTADSYLSEHEAAMRRAERPVDPGDQTTDPLRTKEFARDGVLTVMARASGTMWVPPQDIVVVGAVAWLGDEGIGTTTLEILRNGTNAGHLTWNGDDTATTALEIHLAANTDRLRLQLTEAADGAYGCTVRFRYVLGR
jgi:hypothetical protein